MDYTDEIDDPFDGIEHFLDSSDSDFDTDVEQNIKESLYTGQSEADQLALAMGFGEFIVNGRKVYDIDKDTDEENWNGAMKLYPLQSQHNSDKLSGFEKYINEITSGQRKGPWTQD